MEGWDTRLWRVSVALEDDLAPVIAAQGHPAVFRIGFARTRVELSEAVACVADGYANRQHLWLCYPKRSGGIASDVTRDVGWEPVHALGLLAVTQVAHDVDWSALRFRRRVEIAKMTHRIATGQADAESEPGSGPEGDTIG